MKKPDLQLLAQWLDPVTVAALETRRRKKKEFHRCKLQKKFAFMTAMG